MKYFLTLLYPKQGSGENFRNRVPFRAALKGDQSAVSEAGALKIKGNPFAKPRLNASQNKRLQALDKSLTRLATVANKIDDLQFVLETTTGKAYLIDPLSNKTQSSPESRKMTRDNTAKLIASKSAVSEFLGKRAFTPMRSFGDISE